MNDDKTRLNQVDIAEICEYARLVRRKIVEITHQGGATHVGSALSCTDILAAAYWGVMVVDPENPTAPERDRFILSKGHPAAAICATLAYRGFFPLTRLEDFNKNGSSFAEHTIPYCVPGLDFAVASMGHGLSVAAGMALSSRLLGTRYRVYALVGDGECNEGSIWEAAMFAPAQRLDNMMVIVDYNGWQATDRSENVLALKPLKDKWAAFGWSVYEADGHDAAALVSLMRNLPDGSGKPAAVIAHTVKGKGVSFMEDDNNWHYRIPSEEETEAALRELV